MRIAFISDIHGNAVALDAVLADIAEQEVDQVICLGDIATIGPQPVEVLKRLQALNCPVIMGNHDAALLHPGAVAKFHIAPELSESLTWCYQQLTKAHFDYLRSFLPSIKINNSEHPDILCYHGTPGSNTGMIMPAASNAELEGILEQGSAAIMVGGHTHLQMMRQLEAICFVNPGSVGCPFRRPVSPGKPPEILTDAHYGIIDVSRRGIAIDLRRIAYDVDSFTEVLKESDLPIRGWWLSQF